MQIGEKGRKTMKNTKISQKTLEINKKRSKNYPTKQKISFAVGRNREKQIKSQTKHIYGSISPLKVYYRGSTAENRIFIEF